MDFPTFSRERELCLCFINAMWSTRSLSAFHYYFEKLNKNKKKSMMTPKKTGHYTYRPGHSPSLPSSRFLFCFSLHSREEEVFSHVYTWFFNSWCTLFSEFQASFGRAAGKDREWRSSPKFLDFSQFLDLYPFRIEFIISLRIFRTNKIKKIGPKKSVLCRISLISVILTLTSSNIAVFPPLKPLLLFPIKQG